MPAINAMFSKRLEDLLDEKGIKKIDLAKHLAVERSTITRYAQGRVPDAETLDKLARYFMVSTDYLLGRTDDPQGVALSTPPDQFGDDEIVVIFRGKAQKLSPREMRTIKALLEADDDDDKAKGQL